MLKTFSVFVLIETLWNVKDGGRRFFQTDRSVLIETLWNVKKNGKGSKTSAPSINRNIVECKDIQLCLEDCFIGGINRNIVECKGEKVLAARNEEIEY